MTASFGVGFYGAGMIAKVHAFCHRNLDLFYDPPAARTTLVGVCTSRAETAEAARRRFGFEFATTDYRRLLDRDDIHVVHCAAPNHLHRDFVSDALAAGKHVYCEKPLAASLADAEAIRTAALEAPGSRLGMVFQNRFIPATIRARQLVDEGFLGRIMTFRAEFLHSGYEDPSKPKTWRISKPESGGGALYDLGSHVIDLAASLVGEITGVSAHAETFVRERPAAGDPGRVEPIDVDDHALLIARTADGALGTIEASRVAVGITDELRVEVHGTEGALRFNLLDPDHLEIYDNRVPADPVGGRKGWTAVDTYRRYPKPDAGFPSPKVTWGWLRGHVDCLNSFLAAAAEGREPVPGLAEGFAAQLVMDAAERSARANGAFVEIEPRRE